MTVCCNMRGDEHCDGVTISDNKMESFSVQLIDHDAPAFQL